MAAAIATAGCGADADAPAGPIGYRVLRYDYTVDVRTREAHAVVDLAIDTGGDCLSIPQRAAGLANVTLDGEPIRAGSLADGVLTACGAGWFAGQTATLAADVVVPDETWGDSQVGFSVTEDLEGRPFTYLVSWVGGCDRFGPCDSAPDRFARYRFEVHHAPSATALCPGRVEAASEDVTVCTFDFDGGPTYSTFGIAVGESWTATDLGDWNGVRATLYDSASTGIAAAVDADRVAAFVDWMAAHFGPYPYGDELRLFTGPTYWNGFEHPGNIALSDGLVRGFGSLYARPLEHTMFHEIAHQWAGDQTTLATPYDFVWKEAMAEYLAFAFEDVDTPDVAVRTARAWRAFAQRAEYYPVPDERPPLLDYYGDVYGAGPMVLFRQIEAMFGRDAVLAALADLLGRPRAIGVADVRAALEAATGADLSGYFDAWVYGSGAPQWPRVTIVVDDDGTGVTVTATQVTGGRVFGVAFPVRLAGDGEGDAVDVWLDFGVDGARVARATASPGFAVTGWQVDPDAYSLVVEDAGAAAPPAAPRNPWLAARPSR